MAPRLRLSPQSSLEEIPANGSDGAISEGRPLMEDSSSNDSNNGKTKKPSKETPVAATTVSDVARLHHDYFNLVALIFVIASAAIDWNFEMLMQGMGTLAFEGKHFWLSYGVVNAYFLADLAWVSLVPQCVKSPKTIIQHHIVVIAYMVCPVFWAEYRWFLGPLLSVEINTWFMILRRVVYKQNIPMVTDVVAFSFYLSWIVIRCIIYPTILFHLFHLANVAIETSGRLWHWPMMFIPVHFMLCCLNMKWSYDLFYPIITSWFVKDSAKPAVSSGL